MKKKQTDLVRNEISAHVVPAVASGPARKESLMSYWLHRVEACIRVTLTKDVKTLLCMLDMLDHF